MFPNCLEREELGAVLGRVEGVGGGLVDGHRAGVGAGGGLLAGVDLERLEAGLAVRGKGHGVRPFASVKVDGASYIADDSSVKPDVRMPHRVAPADGRRSAMDAIRHAADAAVAAGSAPATVPAHSPPSDSHVPTSPAPCPSSSSSAPAETPDAGGLPLPGRRTAGRASPGAETEARVRAVASRPPRPRPRAGAALRHPLRDAHRVDPGRPRHPLRRRRHDHHLPVDHRRRVRLHPLRLGRGVRLRRERRAGGEAAGAARRAAARSGTSSPSTARRTADGFVHPARRARGARPGTATRAHPGRFEETGRRPSEPDALATLIYTSGTTGRPKGVELTHDCWVYAGRGHRGARASSTTRTASAVLLAAAGPLLRQGARQAAQLRIGFPTAVDGRVEKIVENLAAVRPTFVCAVPRIFEKVHNKVLPERPRGRGA